MSETEASQPGLTEGHGQGEKPIEDQLLGLTSLDATHLIVGPLFEIAHR